MCNDDEIIATKCNDKCNDKASVAKKVMFYGKIIKNDIQEFFQQMDQIILQIQFRRKKEHPKDYYLKWIDDIINHEDLNHCIILINDYFYSIFEGYDKKLFDEFEREIPCLGIKYGYKNGDFYEIVQ